MSYWCSDVCAADLKLPNKRRLLQPAVAALLVKKRAADGRLHLATDWQDYAEQMWDVLDATPGLRNRAGPRGHVPRPEWRPQTHFETRRQRLGPGVWDLLSDRDPGFGLGDSLKQAHPVFPLRPPASQHGRGRRHIP